jgi:cytochrome P450
MDAWGTRPPEDPYFDSRLNAWVLSRYKDVTAALREAHLIPASARSTTAAVAVDSATHAEFRSQALRALAPVRLQQLEAQFTPIAIGMAGALQAGQPVDLVEHYAKPWSLEVAGIAADIPPGQRERHPAWREVSLTLRASRTTLRWTRLPGKLARSWLAFFKERRP